MTIEAQPRVLLVLSLLLVASGAWAQESDEPATFGFGPTDGEIWIKEIDATQFRDMADVAPQQKTRTRTRIELRYEQVPDGWVVHEVPLSAEMELNDASVDNPGLAQTVGHEIRVHIDDQGQASKAEGFTELMRRFEANIDPQTFARMHQQMSPESMANGELRQWNERLQDLYGQTVKPGEVWGVIDQTTVAGGGLVGLAGYLQFDGWTELEGIRGFKMTYRYDSNGTLMKSVEGKATKRISRRASEEPMPMSNIMVQGTIVRVLVPETGQLLYEVKEEWYEVPLQTMDGPMMRMENSHTYRLRPGG